MPPPAPVNEELPGQVGRYKLVKRLGAGGMAEVFLAEIAGPGGFSRKVALKMVLPVHSANPEVTQMFLDEARIASHFTHPNLVQIYDFGETDGRYYIAMEYARGLSLRALLKDLKKRQARMPDLVAAAVGSHCCAALAYAHGLSDGDGKALQIVHRDITPENIFLTVEGVTKVLDFGIARSTGRSAESTGFGIIKGKPSYMSPEQAGAKELDGRSDVFSLGATLWEALATRKLFEAPDTMALLAKIMMQPALELREVVTDCDPDLAGLVMSALTRLRDQRPSAAALQHGFDGLLHQAAQTTSQAIVAGFLKGTVKSTPLRSSAIPRTVSSPGLTPALGGTPGGTPPYVESMGEWPAPEAGSEEIQGLDTKPALAGSRPIAPHGERTFDEVESVAASLGSPAAAVKPPPPASLDSAASLAKTQPPAPSVASGSKPTPGRPPWIPIALAVGVATLVVGGIGLAIHHASGSEATSLGSAAPLAAASEVTAVLNISSAPRGATILIDGTDVHRVTPAAIPVAVLQDHTWALVLPGYERAEGKADRDHLRTPVSTVLVATAEVQVDATPGGATIECDGVKVLEAAPGMARVARGDHVLRASKEGFVPFEEHLTLTAEHRVWTVALVAAAYLDVTSDPSVAKVSIDGVPTTSPTPLVHWPVKAGERHVLQVSQDNLQATKQVAKLAAGKSAKVALHLVDPALAASDAKRTKLEARQAALQKERDVLDAQNSKEDLITSHAQMVATQKRQQRIDAIDQELDALSEQISALDTNQ